MEFIHVKYLLIMYITLIHLHACKVEWRHDFERHEGVVWCREVRHCNDNVMRYSTVRILKGCERVSVVVWLTEGRSVSCVYSIRFITEWTTLGMGYLNPFVAAYNTRASVALGELTLGILRCRTDQFSRSFPPFLSAAVHI